MLCSEQSNVPMTNFESWLEGFGARVELRFGTLELSTCTLVLCLGGVERTLTRVEVILGSLECRLAGFVLSASRRRIEELSDELLVADATAESKHSEAIDLIELTQGAYDQYSDGELDNDQKRNILTKLFDSVVYKTILYLLNTHISLNRRRKKVVNHVRF